MHITKVELQNFKRFTNLTIDGIPADAKLVLLIGSNGSGKSSVFDAFEFLNRLSKNDNITLNQPLETYLKKDGGLPTSIRMQKESSSDVLFEGESEASFSDNYNPSYLPLLSLGVVKDNFYGRTSFRQLPRLTRTQLGSLPNLIEQDSDRPRFYIDRDERFENDIEQISQRILKEIFRSEVSSTQVKASYIQPINKALIKIFDQNETTKLSLIEILPPLEGNVAQITFQKGQSEIHYNYLSAGEKEIFNILLNLLVRKNQYTDTVYFFDELDLHLNTKLQFNLLKEITENWIPENCQLWTASHSLGFIDYARQYDKGVIIDFDDLDFDQPQTLFPQPKEQLDVYDIAVPKETLKTLMLGKKLVVCENKNDQYYNLLAIPDTIFVGVNNSRDVFLTVKRDPIYKSIRDRDFMSDSEINYLHQKYPNHHILIYYCFENYLYHPDNIAELALENFNQDIYTDKIRQLKNEQFTYILPSLVSSRQRYEEFNNDPNLDYRDTDSIVDDFKSDDFERFYKFFSMKGRHEKIDPMLGKLPQRHLVQTTWFRQQIEAILNS